MNPESKWVVVFLMITGPITILVVPTPVRTLFIVPFAFGVVWVLATVWSHKRRIGRLHEMKLRLERLAHEVVEIMSGTACPPRPAQKKTLGSTRYWGLRLLRTYRWFVSRETRVDVEASIADLVREAKEMRRCGVPPRVMRRAILWRSMCSICGIIYGGIIRLVEKAVTFWRLIR